MNNETQQIIDHIANNPNIIIQKQLRTDIIYHHKYIDILEPLYKFTTASQMIGLGNNYFISIEENEGIDTGIPISPSDKIVIVFSEPDIAVNLKLPPYLKNIGIKNSLYGSKIFLSSATNYTNSIFYIDALDKNLRNNCIETKDIAYKIIEDTLLDNMKIYFDTISKMTHNQTLQPRFSYFEKTIIKSFKIVDLHTSYLGQHIYNESKKTLNILKQEALVLLNGIKASSKFKNIFKDYMALYKQVTNYLQQQHITY